MTSIEEMEASAAAGLLALQQEMAARSNADAAAWGTLVTARTALTDALALTSLYAAADQAAKTVIDSQINSATAQARALENAPADILELATKIALWRSER